MRSGGAPSRIENEQLRASAERRPAHSGGDRRGCGLAGSGSETRLLRRDKGNETRLGASVDSEGRARCLVAPTQPAEGAIVLAVVGHISVEKAYNGGE